MRAGSDALRGTRSRCRGACALVCIGCLGVAASVGLAVGSPARGGGLSETVTTAPPPEPAPTTTAAAPTPDPMPVRAKPKPTNPPASAQPRTVTPARAPVQQPSSTVTYRAPQPTQRSRPAALHVARHAPTVRSHRATLPPRIAATPRPARRQPQADRAPTPLAGALKSKSPLVNRWLLVVLLGLPILLLATAAVARQTVGLSSFGRLIAQHQLDLGFAGTAILAGVLCAITLVWIVH